MQQRTGLHWPDHFRLAHSCHAAPPRRLREGATLRAQGVVPGSRLVLHISAQCVASKARSGDARAGDLVVHRPQTPPHHSVGMGGCRRTPWLPDTATPARG